MTYVVVHESMFGNTRMVAEAIAGALRTAGADVRQLPAAELGGVRFDADDVLVIGAPTHAHTFPGARTRVAARDMVKKSNPPLVLEPTATARGIREWLKESAELPARAAVFDTRANGPRLLTGSAAVRIAHQLRRRHVQVLAPPESFLVSANQLRDGEIARAAEWARTLVGQRRAPMSALRH